MAPTSVLTKTFSILTLLSHIALASFLAVVIYKVVLKKENLGFTDEAWRFVRKNALLFAFIVAAATTAASLFYSEIADYEACDLCWYQRVFLYPQTVLLGIAFIRDDRKVADYIIPLGMIGGAISIYHYALQRIDGSSSCPVGAVSCAVRYVFDFGYITIPMMSLTAFVVIIVLAHISRFL